MVCKVVRLIVSLRTELKLKHLPLETVNPCVLLPGDPERVDMVASRLDHVTERGQSREYRQVNGTIKGELVTILSSGIGAPSAAIAFEEAIQGGGRTLIRLGTCGGAWDPSIVAGTVVIPIAAVRHDGTSRSYVDLAFPAIADPEVVLSLSEAARRSNVSFWRGIVRSHDAFYAPTNSTVRLARELYASGVDDPGAVVGASDMECSILFIIGALRRVRVAALLAVDGSPEPLTRALTERRFTVDKYDKESGHLLAVSNMIEVALSAIASTLMRSVE